MGIIIILQRKNCSDDLVLFLEKKLKNVNEKYQVKKKKKLKNTDNINKLMNVLFVLSILHNMETLDTSKNKQQER